MIYEFIYLLIDFYVYKFLGFNIVGDGTPQAFIPFLTGSTEIELPLTRKRYSTANYVDDVYPFAWKNFSRAGYATLYGEDAYNIGCIYLFILSIMNVFRNFYV